MKRVEAIKRVLDRVVMAATLDIDGRIWDAYEVVKIYEYLDEELPNTAPTACQPGKAVDVWEDPELVEVKEVEA